MEMAAKDDAAIVIKCIVNKNMTLYLGSHIHPFYLRI